ncbi:hypothetical protein HDU67_005912 [Dinochytrium kinnereticum]|nr:hypothetical protein HDU67_005912 [Dinochytrium kinnereticum]
MRLSSVVCVLLASTSAVLTAPAPREVEQQRLVERGEQAVQAALANNVAVDGAQANSVNITALDAAVGSKQGVSAAIANNEAIEGGVQTNAVNISGLKSGGAGGALPAAPAAPATPPQAAAPAPGDAPASVPAGSPAPQGGAVPQAVQIGDNKVVNNVNNNVDSKTDNVSAGVQGNQVSGGIQHNAATTQNNENQGNNTIIGAINSSQDTYHDNRNVTTINQNRTNVTVLDTTFHNQTETNFINNHATENKQIVNNHYTTIQQQTAAAAEQIKPQIYYIQSPGGGYTPVAGNGGAPAPATQQQARAPANPQIPPAGRSKQAYAMLQKIKALNDQVMELAMDIVSDV